jgi:PKD repeat protein
MINEPCHAEVLFRDSTTGKNVFFTAIANSSIGTYQWFFGDGTTASTVQPFISHTYSNNGDYDVCLQFTSFDSCTAWYCDSITIGGCSTNLSINDSLLGKTVYLEGITSNNTTGSFKWNFGDGKSGSGKFVNHEYKKPGTYTICVEYKSKDGLCTIQQCKTIVIKKCYVDVYFSKEINGDTVNFDAFTSPDESGTYFWDLGDGTIMKGKSFSHIYKSSGKYIVTLSYFSKDNVCVCESVFSDTITIKVCPKIRFNTTITGKTVTFSAFTNSSDSSMYYWEFGDGSYGFGGVVSHTYSSSGSYNVTLDGYTHHGACQCLCASTISSDVIVVPNGCPNYTLINKKVNGNQVAFTAKNFPTPSIFSWNFGDGTTTTTSSPFITHTYQHNGVYNFNVTTSHLGFDTCQTISYDSVAISLDTIQIEITLHPNPAINVINFKLDTDKAATMAYEIVNGMGTSLIQDQNIITGPNHHSVDVSILPPGFYMLKIVYDGQVFTKQFMKE